MSDRRRLRVVGPDEKPGDAEDGAWTVVLEDLGVARGYIVEASAEMEACPGPKAALASLMVTLRAHIDECIRQADNARKAVGP
jgi:hypothetical protein